MGAFLLAAMAFAPCARAADWLLATVPQASGKDEQVLRLSGTFQVILTNATAHDMQVWKEYCTWGYGNLSFKFTSLNGKTVVNVQRKPAYCPKNAPIGLIVKPGCPYIMTFNFASREWSGVDRLRGTMIMTTIYRSSHGAKPKPRTKYSDTALTRGKIAWQGEVRSVPIRVEIVR